MTKDVIALTERMPDAWSVLAGLMAGGPDLEVRTAGEAALVQLCDEGGRPLLSVEAPMLVRVPGETARLLGVDAPAPVWWTEARAATGVRRAELLAGAFARRLAHLVGGQVWPADAAEAPDERALDEARRDVTAAPVPAAAQPAVDVLTDKVAVVIQDRPVIAMSAWLSDALRAAEASGRGLHLVTPPTSRLTLPTRASLTGLPSRWVVQDGGGGYHDGLSGAELAWRDGQFTPVDTGGGPTPVAAAFTAGVADDGQRQSALSLRCLHPAADEHLLLGGGLEAAWRALTGGPPAGWGSAEPAAQPWSREALTDFARERAPEETWVVVVGGGAIGTLRISPTAGGVEEDATVAVGHRVEDPAPLADLPALAAVLVVEHRLVSALAQLRVGRADLTSPPRFEPPGTPVAFVLGPEGVADLGRRHAETPPLPDRPLLLGTPGSPGLYYPLGDETALPTGDGWTHLEHLFRHFRAADT
jgi:hypothetical protein